MAVTREQLAEGMSYDDFKTQMTRNQERFAANERGLTLDSADVETFRTLPQPLDVLVLAEDWCTDVIDNLPILGRLATESGKLHLHIFLRDQHLALMDQYLKQGEFRSIPVFAFFDPNMRELGRFIERPDSVSERNAEQRRALFAQHPEFGSPDTPISQLPEDVRVKVMEAISGQREQNRAANNRDVVRELRAIVERAGA